MAGISLSFFSPSIKTCTISRSPIRRRKNNRKLKPSTFLCFAAPPSSEQRIDGDTQKKKRERGKKDIWKGFEWVKIDEIGLEMISIALPAVLALAADPLASLVDTAFVGHLGSTELAAVGVSVSVFNLVSKLLNVPLLNITTSFVAEQQALEKKENKGANESSDEGERRKYLPAVSTSLALAAGIGFVELVTLALGSGFLMDLVGIPIDSPMRVPAQQFLTLRAYGAPPIVLALAAQGTFRGFKDTKTPLYAVGIGNLVNAILDGILIFILGFGVKGAAIATVTWGLLIGRTIAVLLTMTLATSLAARQGPVQMAAHQICLQVWLAVSLLNDALALAAQAMLASEYTKSNYRQSRIIVQRVLQIGGITGIGLAFVLFFGFESFALIFTNDTQVLEISKSGLWFVTISQPINAIAFVIDGLYYGVSDFAYAAYSMFFVGLVSCIFLCLVAPHFGLSGVWLGLVLFMSLRSLAGFYRLGTKSEPWNLIWSNSDTDIKES